MLTRSKRRDGFRYFSQLPAELRQDIWSHCLPYRVVEIDVEVPEGARFPCGNISRVTCRLSHTTYMNKLPPVIAQVCRESRRVAFLTGGMLESKRRPNEAEYSCGGSIECMWEDPKRDVAHLNWTTANEWYCNPEYSMKRPSTSNSAQQLACLQWHASRLLKPASFMVNVVGLHKKPPYDPGPPYQLNSSAQQELNQLKKMSHLLIVMRTVIIHAPVKVAMETDYFGLLGDAPVQIIDVTEQGTVNALLDLAEASEGRGPAVKAQDFQRASPWYVETVERGLREAVDFRYHDNDLTMRVRPAIMFRLCTQKCNTPMAKKNSRKKLAQKKGRGRGGKARATRITKR